MSWKPSRSSGIMFDRYKAKEERHRKEVSRMIESGEYLRFCNLNKFSKHIYLYWTNERRARGALMGPQDINGLEPYCIIPSILPMLKRNKNLVYKPLRSFL